MELIECYIYDVTRRLPKIKGMTLERKLDC